MKYFVMIDDVERIVELKAQSTGEYLCQIDEAPSFLVHASQLHGRLHLIGNGKSCHASVALESEDLSVGGPRNRIKVESQRLRALRESSGSASDGANDGVIASPMPGRVVKNLVNEGDAVSKGQGVVVVEAMKMENELKAPVDGIVKQLYAKDGDLVDAGTPLVDIALAEVE